MCRLQCAHNNKGRHAIRRDVVQDDAAVTKREAFRGFYIFLVLFDKGACPGSPGIISPLHKYQCDDGLFHPFAEDRQDYQRHQNGRKT